MQYSPRRLTETFIAALPQDGVMSYQVRDTRIVGFLVSVNKCSKTYKVQRDLWRGQRGRRRLIKTVRITLGATNELTLEQARMKAEDVIRESYARKLVTA